MTLISLANQLIQNYIGESLISFIDLADNISISERQTILIKSNLLIFPKGSQKVILFQSSKLTDQKLLKVIKNINSKNVPKSGMGWICMAAF